MRALLLENFAPLIEDYLDRLHHQCENDPLNEKLIDRNSTLACDLHSHRLLMFRNMPMDIKVACGISSSFVFLTTRHTWNKQTREQGRLLMPETELYELLTVQRRQLIEFTRSLVQHEFDHVLQSALQVSTSTTGSLRASFEVVDAHNRWSFIGGIRSLGRFCVASTRTANRVEDSTGELVRTKSSGWHPHEVADTAQLGVEMDFQIGQMTLRSKHLMALDSKIANQPDVGLIFGESTMQASLIERAEHCQRYTLVGKHHDIAFWEGAHCMTPPLGDEWGRDYDPSELFHSEQWIARIFEPVRTNFFNGPMPPPMQFLMPDLELPVDAEVALLLGLHQHLGGVFKLVVVFRRLKCVNVYEVISHGRQWWLSQHLATDCRYSFRELQPSTKPRDAPFPEWCAAIVFHSCLAIDCKFVCYIEN